MSTNLHSFAQKSFIVLVMVGLILVSLGGAGIQTAHALADVSGPLPQGGCFSKTAGKSDQCQQDRGIQAQSVQAVSGVPLSFQVNDDTSTAMYYNNKQQFYGQNAEGVYIWVNGAVYGPGHVPAGNYVNAYIPVSNSVSGTGSVNDPWRVTTVVDAGTSGLRIQQEIKYVNGASNVTYSWRVTNTSGSTLSYSLFHAADLYTENNDYGYGYYGAATGAIGGYIQSRSFYQYFQPISAGSSYFEGFYKDVWDRIGSTVTGIGFNNSYLPNSYIDNGAGLQWNFIIAANGVNTISDYGVFNTEIGGITCHTLTISAASGGSIQAKTSPARSCPSNQYIEGSTIWLQATPNAHNELSSWSGVDSTSTNFASVVMNTDRTVGATFRKPVVVLAHGALTFSSNPIWADTCQTNAYHYSANKLSTVGEDENLRAYFVDLPATLDSDYDVWIAHIASGPTSVGNDTPGLYKNAICLANQVKNIGDALHLNPHSIKIIAHGMGGPVSRACVSQYLQGCDNLVDSIMTLGSPHAGVPDYSLGWLQIGLGDLTASRMRDHFNPANPDMPSTNKYVFLGGGWLPTLGASSALGDVFVSSVSSAGWVDTQGTTDPPNWDFNFCNPAISSCPVQPTRMWTHNSHTDYFSSPSEAMTCIQWLFLSGGSQPGVCSATLAAQDVDSAHQITPLVENTLAPAGVADQTIQVDTAGNTTFMLMWSGGNPAFTLTQPGGQVIDPAYAAANPGIVTYSDLPGGNAAPNQRVYTFANALAGDWQSHVTNAGSDPSHYYTFAQLTSARTLTVSPSADTVTPGDLLTVTATLNNGISGMNGATLSGALRRSDGVSDAVVFASQGNGVYTASYNAPNVPGYLTLTVLATGTDGVTPFERQVVQMLGIRSPIAAFNNNYSGSALDDDGNGKAEALETQVGIDVTTDGEFLLSGDLTANGQYVAHTGAQAALTSGNRTLSLRFSGDDIRAAGLNGPYKLTHLVLTNTALGNIPIASANDVWTSSAYNATDFATRCFDLNLAPNHIAGGTLSSNPPPNCGGTQYAAGSVVSVTAVANTGHVFTDWSGDASGVSNPVNVTMNGNRLVMADFTPLCYTLHLASNPPAANGISPDAPPDCNGNTKYTYGSVVQLTASNTNGYTFYNWGGDASGSANPILLTVTADTSITANYTRSEYTLMAISAYGDVTRNPNQFTYHEGDVVKITAVPYAGWAFTNWTGGLTSNLNPGFVTIHGNTTVTAHYVQKEYTLTVTSTHGAVAKNPNKATYHDGDVVRLTATPNAGWVFMNWMGGLSGNLNPGFITIHGNASVTARYVNLQTLNSKSIAANDGWVLESSENSKMGGSIKSNSTINLGDDAARKQYRGILSFSTGPSLPDSAVVTAVTLKVRKKTITGGSNPVTMFQGFMVDINKGFFGTSASLQTSDFQAASNKSYGPFTPSPVGGWYSIDLTGAKIYVNKLGSGGGLTQIRLRFNLDDNNNKVANYLSLYSGNAPTADQPQLVITYYVP